MTPPSTIRLRPLAGEVAPALRGLGWEWAMEDACQNYVAREAVELPESEAEELLQAADTLYELLIQCIPDPIPDDLLRLLAIPQNLWAAVRHSWNDDRHWHLYGRFDIAQTPEGPKLLEFNADTATSIPEVAVVQWASLVAAGLGQENRQVNGVFESLQVQLGQWRELNQDLEPTLLLVYLPESAEDAANCSVVAEAALAAGFTRMHICSIDEMQVSVEGEERGTWVQVAKEEWQRFSFLFKLVPWEILAEEEPELTADLSQLLLSRDVIIANPAYTLLFQSKAILAWLWQCYPQHSLLLNTSLNKPASGHYVCKPVLGREGRDVVAVRDGAISSTHTGDYAGQPVVYQQFAQLPSDTNTNLYQAGVFWAGSSCGIGYRRAKGFITNLSEFVPHLLV
ncbi:glutathionylspermidine synthase family protein [Hymenobacter taeanensis]|uniref:Glutathionylspermidine synthase family protein n=1 Tax=Hymenobacter taeanensis TaxID=2735321 RepID=A0A6M6BC42_9BACT|nr:MULTISPECIES: glutathionylspermidine synthase family protein [Hymenobacter]QJX45408.1 glutathionylspermidine synthase family protein [Hymenobacter taeanensis]UOQ81349.1 glutathionylspermidine synthase family protein [Hymenobacter sp. 5414T-23]